MFSKRIVLFYWSVVLLLTVTVLPSYIFADEVTVCDTVCNSECSYQGKNLQAVAMPIGGIGTGTIWASGNGELSVWQIFLNNYNNFRVPDSFFAIRTKAADGQPVVKVLQTKPYKTVSPMESITFYANYPIGLWDFTDKDFPVKVSMKAYNPMIPLNTKDSAIPCAIFEITAENKSAKPVEVSAMASLQNPVGQDAKTKVNNRKAVCYGGNQNVFSKKSDGNEIFLTVPSQKGSSMTDKRSLLSVGETLRPSLCENLTIKTLASGDKTAGTDVIWVEDNSEVTMNSILNLLAITSSSGGNMVLSMPRTALLKYLAPVPGTTKKETTNTKKSNSDTIKKTTAKTESATIVFEDFDGSSYGDKWTVTGTCFGSQPSQGTENNQQPVSGFLGKGLVNTFYGGSDDPQGTLISKPFTITKKFISFLIGGGEHPGTTCINLKVGDKVVRTETGAEMEALMPKSWDVSEFKGKQGVIEIVDELAGPWAHLNLDQIVFSDKEPSDDTETTDTVLEKETVTFPADTVVFADFEGTGYGNWTAEGTAFGTQPSQGTEPKQVPVLGFLGNGLANSFAGDGDKAQGALISKPFTIDKRYIYFLIGGGNHPNETCINLKIDGITVISETGSNKEDLEQRYWDVLEYYGQKAVIEIVDKSSGGWGHVLVDHLGFSNILKESAEVDSTIVFEDFEGPDYKNWKVEGEAFGTKPSQGAEGGQAAIAGFEGTGLANTFFGGSDEPLGTLTSKPFTITKKKINFLIGGGRNPGKTCINLKIDDKVVRTETGASKESLDLKTWDVAEFKGKQAVIEIVDNSSGGWGHVNVDQITFTGNFPIEMPVTAAIVEPVTQTSTQTDSDTIVFEDFESGNYKNWKVDGPALGDEPSQGTESGQATVTGFMGNRLVNTFLGGSDGPQGTLTSKPFTINKMYINFLIGGGNHPGETCINLKIGDDVVRTETGSDKETLTQKSWDVSDLKGKQVVIEIVDKNSGAWGHVNVDQIVFVDNQPGDDSIADSDSGIAIPSDLEISVFEDFESNYNNWTIDGTAFGRKPSQGVEGQQQPVTGFIGNGLVNTFFGGSDNPQGTLTSKPFIIPQKYIIFLVGGGNHPGITCINLKVGDKVVRTETGSDKETLTQKSWDVSEFKGKEAIIEIVDKSSGGWGHVNVDHITFSNYEGDIFKFTIGKAFNLDLKEARLVSDSGSVTDPESKEWAYNKRLDISKCSTLPASFKVIQKTKDGKPLIISGGLGKGTITLVLGDSVPVSWKLKTIADLTQTSFKYGDGIPIDSPAFGSMSLSTLSTDATANTAWTDADTLAADLADDGKLSGPESSPVSPAGETVNAALAVPVKLAPGEKKTVTFVVSWFFPNFVKYKHKGMMYSSWYNSAADVGADVRKRYAQLSKETKLYRDTMYETNLPCWFVDSITSQSCIFRGLTCFWVKDHATTHKDYFAGYEGCAECCPLNCTHVWNYAQTHARLYPELGRNLREYDFMVYMKTSGETQHRQHSPHGAYIDGHCAVIEAAYREHLLSPDNTFLDKIWPNVKKATDWLITKIDKDEDGVNAGHQLNTYDVATSGAQTFIGSQYLSALAAAEKMALIEGDTESAQRYAKIRKAGTENQDKQLWNGEYYIQNPDPNPARDYNTGCHSDQLLGQWWSHMLDNGYLYPEDHVKQTLQSIMKYNFRKDLYGFAQKPRPYALDSDGGLIICTWPKGGRPNPFILYADEIWTGIEYSAAGLMMYEGMVDDALTIVNTISKRYDGVLRNSLNSGPGGNRFNELECGTFYARAMSNWGLLLAAQGFVYDGPKQRIGFRPNWKPEDHKSFFTAAEGWGLFTQKRDKNSQSEEIKVKYGKLPVKELEFVVPENIKKVDAKVSFAGKDVAVEQLKSENKIVLKLKEPVNIASDQTLKISFKW